MHGACAQRATRKHPRNVEYERSGDFPHRRFSFTPFAFNNFLLKPTTDFADSPSTRASRIVLMRWLGLRTLRHSEGNCTSFQMNIMSSQQKQLRPQKEQKETICLFSQNNKVNKNHYSLSYVHVAGLQLACKS